MVGCGSVDSLVACAVHERYRRRYDMLILVGRIVDSFEFSVVQPQLCYICILKQPPRVRILRIFEANLYFHSVLCFTVWGIYDRPACTPALSVT